MKHCSASLAEADEARKRGLGSRYMWHVMVGLSAEAGAGVVCFWWRVDVPKVASAPGDMVERW